MHDIRFIRENPQAFDAGLARRGLEPLSARILELDGEKRAVATELQQSLARRNEASKAIGQAMAQKDMEKAEALKAEVATLKDSLSALEEKDREAGAALDAMLAAIPNLPADDVPEGPDESANVEVSRWGTPRSFDFEPKDHADFGPALGLDFEAAATISGARFAALRGGMARLHRALAQYMLDTQTGVNGHEEVNPPLLVRDQALFGTSQLPKFAEDLFQTTDGRWLIPTAEVSLTNLVREQIVPDDSLPLRFTALTPCFRSEAGSAGRDTRGFIRQHQFEKVELVTICRPEESDAEHQRMVKCAEGILEALGLPYRKITLCTGDIGFGARKTWTGSLVAQPEHLSRNQLRLQLRRFSGPAHECPLQTGGREEYALPSHPQRLGPRGRTHAGRSTGKLSKCGWQRRYSRSPAPLYGRPDPAGTQNGRHRKQEGLRIADAHSAHQ